MELTARANRGRCSAEGREIQYVSVSFRAPRAEKTQHRPDVNVGIVLDRSGSMGGSKMELARKAANTSIGLLHDRDRFALVAFDHEIETAMPSSHATREAQADARQRLAAVYARGNTDLGGGWLRGADEVEPHRAPETVTRVLLATDGMANSGMTHPEQFYDAARKLRAKGIVTSTIGIGSDFEEVLLQGIAHHGGGHAYFAEQPVQLLDILAGELGETIEITLREPVLDVEIPAGMNVELLDEFPLEPRPGRLGIALGDLTSEQVVELVFEVTLPPGHIGDTLGLDFGLRVSGGAEPVARTRVEWRFATPAEVAATPRASGIDYRAAELIRARSEQAALDLNNRGDFDRAVETMRRGQSRILGFGTDDPAVREIAESMDESSARVGGAMHRMASKSMRYGSSSKLRGRTVEGLARKHFASKDAEKT